MTDMMDDLRVFKLRSKDTGRKVHLLTYGDISRCYSFICFDEKVLFSARWKDVFSKGDNIPFDLLDDIYYKQRTHDGKRNIRLRYDERNDHEINVLLTYAQECWVKESVAQKEETEKYLCDKYDTLLKKHKKITLLPFAFYLADDWEEQNGVSLSRKFSVNVIKLALEELQERFDKMIKTLKSHSEYEPACAYTRLILLDEQFRPFYLVNFFFRGDDISDFFAKDIWEEWLNTRCSRNKENERATLYAFEHEHKPCRNDVEGLLFSRPDRSIFSIHDEDEIIKKLLNFDINNFGTVKNNRKSHENFFRLQAQKYNAIPGSRAKTFSDNFTYTLSAKKKMKDKSD
ncbi:hypothetical protein EDI29_18545 [Pectobacterium polonicum]|uniref:hypothetical protein n=1 Tax=Pectobacterium polonicum TaxID=2485124 RepID=UPI0010F9125B|nr:hypothetical protein [Pectobacterium polonicum]TKY80865.1 hypothetical protein EDI29_18545 [Pectobacterium polonicum]